MKKILSFLARPPVLLLVTLYVLLLIAYFAWGRLFPGKEADWKLFLAVALVGLLSVLLSALPAMLRERKRVSNTVGPVSKELDESLAILSEGRIGKTDLILRRPWALVLGPSLSGKASALAHTTFARRITPVGVRDPLCPLWEVNQAGNPILVQPRARVRGDDDYWNAMISWLSKRRPVDAVLLHISAPQLLGSETEIQGGYLRDRLRSVTDKLRPDVPLMVLVSQCDRIDGFLRYFAGLNPKERAQAWGFSLSPREGDRVSDCLRDTLEGQAASGAGLFATLLENVSDPFETASSAEERAAVLGLPKEIERLCEGLGRFLDALYPRGIGDGLPRLAEVCFSSTTQGGEIIAGSRHEATVRGHHVRVRPALEAPLQMESLFLRGALQRFLDRLLVTSRPPLRLHAFSLSASLALCILAGYVFGNSWSFQSQWLAQVSEGVKGLSNVPHLKVASYAKDVRDELSRELFLSDLLLAEKYRSLKSSSTTAQAHRVSTEFFLCRAGRQFVAPLVEPTKNEGVSVPLQKNLSSNPIDQYNALKAIALLSRKNWAPNGVKCPDPEASDKEFLVEYLSKLWKLGKNDGDLLRADLTRFVNLYLGGSSKEFFRTESPEVEAAQRALLRLFGASTSAENDPRGVAKMYYHLRVQQVEGLSTRDLQLKNTNWIKDPGMERAHTFVGCAPVFTPQKNWGQWLACVRGEDVKADRAPETLAAVYKDKHLEKWRKWLQDLEPRETFPEQDARAAGESLVVYKRDLTAALRLVGKGNVSMPQPREQTTEEKALRKAAGKGVDKVLATVEKAADKLENDLPDECRSARNALSILSFAAGDEDRGDSPATDANDARTAFHDYMNAVDEMAKTLKDLDAWRTSKEGNFAPYHAALSALKTLTERRRKLQAALSDLGNDLKITANIESKIRSTIINMLRGFLSNQWSALYADYQTKLGQAEELRKFAEERVGKFAKDFLDPLDLDTKRQVLCPTALRDLDNARRVPAPAPVPPGTPAAPPPAPPPPTAPRNPRIYVLGCERPPQHVTFETAGNGRYDCEPSNHYCKSIKAPAQASAGPLKAFVEAHFTDNRFPLGSELMRSSDSLKGLVQGRIVREDKQEGLVAVIFDGPKQCRTKIYVDPALFPADPKPSEPGKPVYKLSLPDRVTCP